MRLCPTYLTHFLAIPAPTPELESLEKFLHLRGVCMGHKIHKCVPFADSSLVIDGHVQEIEPPRETTGVKERFEVASLVVQRDVPHHDRGLLRHVLALRKTFKQWTVQLRLKSWARALHGHARHRKLHHRQHRYNPLQFARMNAGSC